MWTLLCIYLYFNPCDGAGLIELIPTRFESAMPNFRFVKSEQISLNGTDRHTVAFGYKDRSCLCHHRGFPANSSPPFSTADTFFAIRREFFITASITRVGSIAPGRVATVVRHFFFNVDFIRDGKTKHLEATNDRSNLTLLYRMTCDSYSKGLLCELCRTQPQHPRFLCAGNGTRKVCRKGFADPARDCSGTEERFAASRQLRARSDSPAAARRHRRKHKRRRPCRGSNPCRNGGTCSRVGRRKKCKCRAGFRGRFCEKDVNECLAHPCKNGGRCRNFAGGYSCDCGDKFAGENCQLNASFCLSSPCKNGGVCVVLTDGSRCNCPHGFHGRNCAEDVDECEKFRPCKNHGVCQNTMGSFVCICPDRFFGSVCQYEERNCLKNSCLEKESCSQIDDRFFCRCRNMLVGDNCGRKHNPCKIGNKLCQNNGRCVPTEYGITCKCIAPYEGRYCQLSLSDISNRHSQQGGSQQGWTVMIILLYIALCSTTLGIILCMTCVVCDCWSKQYAVEMAEDEKRRKEMFRISWYRQR